MSPGRTLKTWGGRWDLNPRHSEPQSEGSGGSPNDFRGFSIQKGRKKEQKRRVFNPSFSQVLDGEKRRQTGNHGSLLNTWLLVTYLHWERLSQLTSARSCAGRGTWITSGCRPST